MDRVCGFLTLVEAKNSVGRQIPLDVVVANGWVTPNPINLPIGLKSGEVPIGENLFVDNGRQLLAYCIGNKAPVSDYVIAKFGVGLGDAVPNTADVGLEDPLTFYDSDSDTIADAQFKPIDSITFPAPFLVRVLFTLAATEANDNLITELGLFSGNETLIARRVITGLNKQDDFAPTLAWNIRL